MTMNSERQNISQQKMSLEKICTASNTHRALNTNTPEHEVYIKPVSSTSSITEYVKNLDAMIANLNQLRNNSGVPSNKPIYQDYGENIQQLANHTRQSSTTTVYKISVLVEPKKQQ